LPTPNTPANAARFQFHWLSITRILWKSKIALVALWLVVGVALAAIVHELPAIYRAECLLLVVEQKIPDKYVTATVNTDPQIRLAAISHLILSNQHLQSIIDTFDLYKTERQTMTKDQLINRMREKDISLALESGLSGTRPDAFRISYEAKDPKLAADVANRLAALIIDENARTRENQAEDTSQFIGAQLQQAKQTLDTLESRVSQWKLTHNGELPEQENALSASFASLQVKLQGNQEGLNRADQSRALLANSLSLAQSSLSTLERSAEEAREQAKRRPQTAAPDPITGIPAPPPAKTRRQELKEELATQSLRYGDEHPVIRRLKAELAELPPDKVEPAPAPVKNTTSSTQATAAVSEPAVPQSILTAIMAEKERVSNLRVQLDLANKEFESSKAERVRIMREVEATQARIDRLPLREQEMAALTRDYEMAKQNYKSLLDRKLSASMATDLERSQQGERFTLIDKARVPEQPAKPPRRILYSVAAILSLAISALVILAKRLPKDTMLGEWELTPGVIVLGRVPRIETSALGLADASSGAHR
jgi:polysaccharide biosynthesis transport protein